MTEVHGSEVQAVEAAATGARRFLISRKGFRSSITSTEGRTLEFSRARWRGRTRRVIIRQMPTMSRSRTLEESPEPSVYDPWAETSSDLAAKTRRTVTCPTCGGEKKVRCPDCGGSTSVRCNACGGRGRTVSERTGKTINCKACRGTGSRRCSCRSGTVRCSACEARGRVEQWLEITEELFVRVTLDQENLLSQSFVHRLESGDFDRGGADWPVPPALTWTGASPEQAPEGARNVLEDMVPKAEINPGQDRLEALDFQCFRGEVVTVHYRLFGVPGVVDVPGWSFRAAQWQGDRKPLRRRLAVLGTAAVLALAGSLGLAAWYSAQHFFLAGSANASLLWLSSLILPLAVLPPIALLAPPRAGRRKGRILVATAPFLAILCAQVALASSGYPSLAHSKLAAEAGQLEEALFEASACSELGIEEDAASRFHDELQFRFVSAASSPKEAWDAASRPFFTSDARSRAEAHALSVTIRQASALLGEEQLQESQTVLGLIPESLRNDDGVRSLQLGLHLHRASACADGMQTDCVLREFRKAQASGFSEEDLAPARARADAVGGRELASAWRTIRSRQPLDARIDACGAIQGPLRFVEAAGSGPADQQVTREEVDRVCENLREEKRLEAVRRAEAAARAHEAALRAWARAPLRCNDGSLSPSCVCGQSSRRGCCSHHRGVAGCSRPYPR